MPERANSKKFIKDNFPNLLVYKVSNSRMWESKYESINKDNWWIQFNSATLDKNEFIVFAGAQDYINKEFKIFKVPSKYIKDNLHKLDVDKNGVVHFYLHIKDYIDIRKDFNLSFKEFAVN